MQWYLRTERSLAHDNFGDAGFKKKKKKKRCADDSQNRWLFNFHNQLFLCTIVEMGIVLFTFLCHIF